jgi:hypothetical protein
LNYDANLKQVMIGLLFDFRIKTKNHPDNQCKSAAFASPYKTVLKISLGEQVFI